MIDNYLNIHSKVASLTSVQSISTHTWQRPLQKSYYSLGIHPWKINEIKWNDFYNFYKEYFESPQLIFIGETGLDYFKDINRKNQELILIKHIELAAHLKKPLLIHCVKAINELKRLIRNFQLPVVLHDYNGNPQQTKELLKMKNIYFSLGQNLYRNNSGAQKSVNIIPLNRIFLETDEMDISIESVYKHYSQLTNKNLEVVRLQIKINFDLLI